jgi:pimeloyl-ACP methyl ester carboxylesterase
MKISRQKLPGQSYVRYFSGFSLQGEAELFDAYLSDNPYYVAGFSYGAQQAFEYALSQPHRIDRLILLSPAFFQTQSRSFKRTQLHYFKADKQAYLDRFALSLAHPGTTDIAPYLTPGTYQELKSLLEYQWDEGRIRQLLAQGTRIDVFLGAKDQIIESQEAFAFFSRLTTTYLLRDAGHLLECRLT